MSLNDKAAAALKRELVRAFPERGENDAGHDRLAEALTGKGWHYTSQGNGATVTIHAPDGRTLLLQGDDAARFLDRESDTHDGYTIAELCESYADAFDAPTATKPAHTPGPWTLHHEPSLNRFAVRAEPFGTKTILSVSYWERTLPWNREQAEANARLITAAPELLEACKALLRMIDGLPWHLRDAAYKAFNERTGGLPGSLPKPISNARAAIAKAEGGAK